jgi:hypothetical protein
LLYFNCNAILDNYEIENSREVGEIISEWLLITGSLTILCVTPTPYQSRPITFFTHDIVYQQHEKYILRDKGLKDKTLLKYIYNALLISYWTFGPVSLRSLPVQHKIYRSWYVGPLQYYGESDQDTNTKLFWKSVVWKFDIWDSSLVVFIRPSLRRDVLWYTNVRPSVCPFHMSHSNLRTPWPIHFKFHRVIGIDGLMVCMLYGEISNFHSRIMGLDSSNCTWF